MESNAVPHSVLVIEDDPFILDIIVLKFTNQKWNVTSAMNGEKGLELAKSNPPDIILLDILLPGMSGYEALEKIKADEALKDIPVLILSNYGQKEEIEKSLSLGAVDHLIKANIIIDEVIGKVTSIIDGKYKR